MKFCTKCGSQLHDDNIFCTSCGNQTSLPDIREKIVNSTNTKEELIGQINNQEKDSSSSSIKPKLNKLFKVFNFENISKKYKTIAKVISAIYKILFIFILLYAVLVLLFSISNGFFFQMLLLEIICIPLCYLLFILLHIPLWKLYASGDIYDSFCDDKTYTEKDNLNN